jgi:hypothetical protein
MYKVTSEFISSLKTVINEEKKAEMEQKVGNNTIKILEYVRQAMKAGKNLAQVEIAHFGALETVEEFRKKGFVVDLHPADVSMFTIELKWD